MKTEFQLNFFTECSNNICQEKRYKLNLEHPKTSQPSLYTANEHGSHFCEINHIILATGANNEVKCTITKMQQVTMNKL